MAYIVSVNISAEKGTEKHPVAEALLRRDHGIEGDAHAGNWHRQISLLAQESIDRMSALGAAGLVPGIFAENITVRGLELHTLPVGTRLRLGNCEVELTQIGKECRRHCKIHEQVGMCIMPTEGIFAKVLKGGTIKAGDKAAVINPAEETQNIGLFDNPNPAGFSKTDCRTSPR
ncbi:MAG: MOSC domain-containing protein [Treponema sp.]|nr:MOSC domain-containing protein [Treponema sp.]